MAGGVGDAAQVYPAGEGPATGATLQSGWLDYRRSWVSNQPPSAAARAGCAPGSAMDDAGAYRATER